MARLVLYQNGRESEWIAVFTRPLRVSRHACSRSIVLANNLANVNTAGYKAQKEFYRAFYGFAEQPLVSLPST